MMPKPVISIGECLIDLIAPGGIDLTEAHELEIREGGAPANVAVALARLSVPSRLHTVVGDDPFGERLRSRLAREGVETAMVRVVPGGVTTVAFAWSDAVGNGHFRIHRNADSLLCPDDVTPQALEGAEAIVVGSVAMSAEPSRSAVVTALRHANEMGIPVVVDLNIRPGLGTPMDETRLSAAALITSAEVVKLSVDDARSLWGSTSIEEAAAALDRFDRPIAIITDGSVGAALRTTEGLLRLDAFEVKAIEPTGAGDAFTGAFISRMIANHWKKADREDLRFAMAAGALATTHRGAMDGLPTLSEVETFLRNRDS